MGHWSVNPDPSEFIVSLFSYGWKIQPKHIINDGQLSKILDLKRKDSGQIKDFQYYQKMLKMIDQHTPWIPLIHSQQTTTWRPEVHDIVFQVSGLHRFYKVRLDQNSKGDKIE